METLIRDIQEAARVVGSTYGPNGSPVLIHPKNAPPYFTQDGITALKEYNPRSLATQLLVDMATRVVQKAGDGTTTAVLLAAALLEHRLDLRPRLEEVLARVKGMSLPASETDIVGVAQAAAKNDVIGQGVGKLIYSLGSNGFVRGVLGAEFKAYQKPGYDLGTGLLLPQQLAFPDNMAGVVRHRQTISLTNPVVVILGHTIRTIDQLLPILEEYEKAYRYSRPLVLVCADIEKAPIEFIMHNFYNHKPSLPAFIVRGNASDDPQERYQILRDLQFATGCKHVYSVLSGKTISEKGVGFDKTFGDAISVELSMSTARFVVDRNLQERIEEIRGMEGVEERLSKLSGAVGVIEYSAHTKAEERSVELALEDAVLASQGAMREGYVFGGAGFWKGLASEFPEYAPAFLALADKLPEGEVRDSAEVARQCLASAASLVGELLDTKYIVNG